jgi:sugar phosphate isomerase/epimerase
MRLAFSNIAWDREEDVSVVGLLEANHVNAVDLVPGKYFPDPEVAKAADVALVARWWHDRGFEITGMQALLFGASGLNVFGNDDSRRRLLRRLDSVFAIGEGLSARNLVFGSPRQRDMTGLSGQNAVDMAVDFFSQAGDLAAARNVVLCLEPNPVRYGCNFMTDAESTADIVRRVGHPAIRMQLDLGAIAINGEDAAEVISRHADLIAHIHASEPDLVPLGEGTTNHAAAAAAIRAHLPDHVVSIEVRGDEKSPHLKAVASSLLTALRYYR